MPSPDSAELLASVNVAIKLIAEGAQSYTVADRSYTRADLPRLVELRNTLTREVARTLTRGRPRVRTARLR